MIDLHVRYLIPSIKIIPWQYVNSLCYVNQLYAEKLARDSFSCCFDVAIVQGHSRVKGHRVRN